MSGRETYWMASRGADGALEVWDGKEWTQRFGQGLRFARKQDAEQFIAGSGLSGAEAREYADAAAPAAPPAPGWRAG